MLQQTIHESINPSWRTFLWLDSLQRRFILILLHVPKMLQQTIHESVIPSWRPSCGSISFNIDSFGHYFTS
ncbi:uncharacterized protein LACBIDRAFT_310090 [Laccaria bicolor S238N-H82]|uniref:Predicted protein n=1 Tax=Laccaria bicolor (strain S238N-H82 / ATCC MYA-4686) TaxID=486041 RepID=B0DTM5_LACBS|nr:uncharacterized protein LACBIDRAFT_310090 [Laccaria bicolor S238N-H82]EDR02083.1 predicted protein [Laccaria bicolor S238N-H82]|eukprot:XP_001887240.1 predicted protein [Laccaria bicolor S238N-H82]